MCYLRVIYCNYSNVIYYFEGIDYSKGIRNILITLKEYITQDRYYITRKSGKEV